MRWTVASLRPAATGTPSGVEPPAPQQPRRRCPRHEHRRRVAGAGEPDDPRRQVELRVHDRREGGRRHLLDEAVEALQDGGWRAPRLRQRPGGAAQLAHGRRGAEPAPDDVAHHDRQDALVGEEDVVPVAPDLEHLDPGAVGRRDGEADVDRRVHREQRVLQLVGDGGALLLQQRAVQRQSGLLADGQQQLGVERVVAAAAARVAARARPASAGRPAAGRRSGRRRRRRRAAATRRAPRRARRTAAARRPTAATASRRRRRAARRRPRAAPC